MPDYNANIAPFINIIFYVTGEYGVERPTHTHVGLDIATSSPQDLFSMLDGRVYDKGYTPVRGYYIIIKGNSGLAFLYQHLESASPLNIGDSVEVNQYVGREGNTGESTGLHLHLEIQDLSNREWNFANDISYYQNPATFMGIPNQYGISAIYDGIPKYKNKTR